MKLNISSFKAYDVRGRIPDELNADIAYRIANGMADFLKAKRVILGRDIRSTSEELANAVAQGLMDAGVDVIDIGLCGTEGVYFATGSLGACGGIMVTASHNPADYNGMKLVRENAKPIGAETGLKEIRLLAESENRFLSDKKGNRTLKDISLPYIKRILDFIDIDLLKPMRIVVNPGNGGAGLVVDQLSEYLPFDFVRVDHNPDSTFPNGIPNPLLPKNHHKTADIVKNVGADFGVAFDGDFDRCFFFDEKGTFVPGEYVVGLLGAIFLEKEPGSKIVHDPRVIWNTQDIVADNGGASIQSKTGHAFIKQTKLIELMVL